MLFKRKIPLSFGGKIRGLLWPEMGFRRLLEYYKFRSIRIPASEHAIAAGIAFGCLVSWTPTFGTHLLQCLLFCWVTRTSFIAAFIGSALGNFLTTPLMMLIAYHVGKFILLTLGLDQFVHHTVVDEVTEESLEATKIFMPTLIGGYFVGIVTFPLYYYPSYYMVKGARVARKRRMEAKAHEHAQQVTGQAE